MFIWKQTEKKKKLDPRMIYKINKPKDKDKIKEKYLLSLLIDGLI